MASNFGVVIAHAAQCESYSPAAQAYLWCMSRVDNNKFIQRTIASRRTSSEVKMVLAEFHTTDRLPCGMTILKAMQEFDVCEMLTRVFENTFVYMRRKPTSCGLAKDIHQIVISWNLSVRYYKKCETLHDAQMRSAFEKENESREFVRYMSDDAYREEMREEAVERWADLQQIRSMIDRSV